MRTANITGWLDATDIAAGGSKSSAVRDALQVSSAVVVFLSRNALTSKWVQFELGAAEALGKTIIPELLPGAEPREDLPELLKDRWFIGARSSPPSSVVEEIRRALD